MNALKTYLSNNRRSHGGKITSISEDDDCYVVTFANMEVAQEVLSHTHELMGTSLQVRHRKNPTIEVITDGSIDEERLKVYFTNTHSSGGGPIERMIKDSNGVFYTTVQHKQVFYITFQHRRAAVDVVRKPSHFIGEKEVTVSERLSLIDGKTLLIKGIPTSCDNGFLRDYLEGLGSAENRLSVTGIIRGEDETIAVVSLLHHIDGKTRRLMADELKSRPLSGQILSVFPVVVTRSVQLSGITKRITQDQLLEYFEDTEKSGGGKILEIIPGKQQGTAIIRFKDPKVVPTVVSKLNHEFGFGPIAVFAHYEPLGTIAGVDFTTSSSTPTDKTTIHRAIKRIEQTLKHVDPRKLRLLEKQLPTIRSSFPNLDFDITHDSHEVLITGVEQDVQQAHDMVEAKLDEFKERRWQVSPEVHSVLRVSEEIKKTIDETLTQAKVLNDVVVAVRDDEVTIWAVDEATAGIAAKSVRPLFAELSRDVSREVLGVGGWNSFMAQSNEDANFSAVMSADKFSGTVKIAGLIQVVDDMEKKLDDFLIEVDTSVVSVDEAVLNVLLKGREDEIQKIESANGVKIKAVKTGFEILGPRDRMSKVSKALMDLASTVIKSKEQYKEPGLQKLFSKDAFQNMLKKIEENHRCTLLWSSNTYPQAPATKRIRKHPSPIPQAPTPAVGLLSVGPITIDIHTGLLEFADTDAIVNPVISSKVFTVIGEALVEAGGESIRGNCQANWDNKVNGVLLTDAGTLRCKKVVHMVLPKADKLSEAVCQCLVLSNQAGLTSIAFPAIGTGRFGLTPSQSANAIRVGIEQFVRPNPNPVLTTVKLTIYDGQMLADYRAEFCSIPSEPGPAAIGDITTPIPGQQEMSFGLVRMQVEQGDICQEKTDVVVSTVLKNMGFTVVTKALVKAGGQSIADDLKEAWPKRSDIGVFTDAGRLASKKIAHMILPSASELKDAVLACLKKADTLGMKSISFPAIGTGGSMSQVESARGIYSAVQEFGLKENPQNLTLVRVIVYDIKTLGTFHLTMHQFSSDGHVPASPPASPLSSSPPASPLSSSPSPPASPLSSYLSSASRRASPFLSSASPASRRASPYLSSASRRASPYLSSASRRASPYLSYISTSASSLLSSASTPASPGLFGSIDVQIQQGDLTMEKTDAVVNPVRSDGGGKEFVQCCNFNGNSIFPKGFFAVGHALEKAGGANVRTDCQSSWDKRVNEVLVKDEAGGKLKCKKIIHMVCPDAKSMKGRVLECLQQAESNGLTSVAFPAIGTGGFGVSAADAARETVQAIEDFALKHNPRSVKLVRVTVFQASMVAEFQRALQTALLKAPVAPTAGAAAAAVTPVVAPVDTTRSNADVEQVVEVTFFACKQLDVDNAKTKVSETINRYITKESVSDERLKSTVQLLNESEKDSIIQMGTKKFVLVTITGNHIDVAGLTDDVVGVLREIEFLLWEKKTASDAAFVEEFKKDVIKVPDHWATLPSGTTGAHIDKLQPTSLEFKEVEKKFLASVGSKPQIVSISRVQNEAKYKAYMFELKEREKRLGKGSIEKVLYHGTSPEVVDNINEGGFNRSYCGKNATYFGKGMYFARNASYSAQEKYSTPDSQGNKYIYQSRVIVGEYTKGEPNIVEPPPKNPSNAAIRYDSVVDNVANPGIFVVFRDNEAYPEYLIVFK
ncbi:uncharacterized protein LOC118420183 [Branchiostoma floridae]|uniref:Poly [ADP-ribose] polymerase n=1 Tax=Branchiostoma floridae TaxID=7739 RepID=A0A9J7MXU4_BRAFL|nr:uncharacterized protein LOC118420183 [Branchiostoma floridae]